MDTQEFIQPGLKSQKEFVVEERYTASHVGSGSVKVLATPMMIAFMEITACEMLDEHLPEGFSSVGTHVNVRHTAPSKLGATVRVEVEVQAVEGSKVDLSVAVWDGEQQVGGGTHERFVIEVERFLKRLA